ncbi:hypothetical protein Cni_G08678 [Canna indica]|uniref:Uncharacterized protein n=1 Tax=Canna indica TaxID=4628 RepID=A0AAQ3K1E6_9LILI|nr:hypothetical protein Cni_G08678 [Canna indica]
MGFDHRNASSPTSSPPRSRIQRLGSSICSYCCFGGAAPGGDDKDERPASLVRSSAAWIRQKALELPEIGSRCRNLAARIRRHRHARRASVEFVYDPLSYALNFDEGLEDDAVGDGDDFRYRSFSSRLPASPPPAKASFVS